MRILQTTDLHGCLLAYDYHADRPTDAHGLSRTATLIHQARSEVASSLLLDNGDFLFGNPLSDAAPHDADHPVIAAMNALGYDAVCLGNHELNFGLGPLMEVLGGARFDVLSANVLRADDAPDAPETLLPGGIIVTRDIDMGAGQILPIKIGLIGLVPPQITTWDEGHLAGKVSVRGIVDAAQDWALRLRDQGADIIVAMNHSGIGDGLLTEDEENAGLSLSTIDEIDVILCGHQHGTFPDETAEPRPGVDPRRGTLNGKPAVMAGFWGSHLGVIDLEVERAGARWRITDHRVELRPIARRHSKGIEPVVPDDPEIVALSAAAHSATVRQLRVAIGQTDVPLHSYFALLAPSSVTAFIAQAQAWYAAQHLKDGPHADLPLLSAASAFRAGGQAGPDAYTEVPAGPLTLRSLHDIYSFPNTLNVLVMTGAEIAEWLEHAAGQFNQLYPNPPDQWLRNAHFPTYSFDTIYGLTYRINLNQPARYDLNGVLQNPSARRIEDVRWRNAPLRPAQRFAVAVNSYRATGSGGFMTVAQAPRIFEGDKFVLDILAAYVRAGMPAPFDDTQAWRLVAQPGTKALLRIGPGAKAYPKQMNALPLDDLGPLPDGFSLYRMAL